MRKNLLLLPLILLLAPGSTGAAGKTLVWPQPPDPARVEFVKEIRFADLKPQRDWVGSVLRVVGGRSDDGELLYPFDIVVVGGKLFLTCQEIPALVEIDPVSSRYRMHKSDPRPFRHPVAVCAAADKVYVSDSETGTVYGFDGSSVYPVITEGLARPTGLAYLSDTSRLYVVDTGKHSVEEFDLAGRHTGTIGERGPAGAGFNYPTFASSGNGFLLVNDTLNYRIKFFAAGEFIKSVGEEGDGPGAFARPKGVVVDDRGNLYVVDGLFDNIQVFDPSGRIALVVGSAGREPGQFWSPAGIDIVGDLIYIADTFNHRIQILRILGG